LNDEEFCQDEYSFLRTIAGKMKDTTNGMKSEAKHIKEKQSQAKPSKEEQSKAKQRKEKKGNELKEKKRTEMKGKEIEK
jgi:hypothetical protein